jgi:hypothetical protein
MCYRLIIRTAILLLACLSTVLYSADDDQDIFSGLKIGSSIRIIIHNDNSFTGEVTSIVKDKIGIAVSCGTPVLIGTISFYKKEIKTIEKLNPYGLSEKKTLASQKKEEPINYTQEGEPPQPENPEPEEDTASSPTAMSDEEMLKLLDQFPPGDDWNENRRDNILHKNAPLRTPDENAFLTNYDSWLTGQEIKARLDRKALFEKFSPDKGWTEEKYKGLSSRRIVLHQSLTSEEEEFVNRFSDWQQAQKEYEEQQKGNTPEITPEEPKESEETPEEPNEESGEESGN